MKFDEWIRSLSEGISYTYAKGTSLYYGLAGLGLANAWLYYYFKETSFLKTSIKICEHILIFLLNKIQKLY